VLAFPVRRFGKHQDRASLLPHDEAAASPPQIAATDRLKRTDAPGAQVARVAELERFAGNVEGPQIIIADVQMATLDGPVRNWQKSLAWIINHRFIYDQWLLCAEPLVPATASPEKSRIDGLFLTQMEDSSVPHDDQSR
jgi:hypothetical protein